MLNKVRNFLRDESGASLAEYAVLLVILGGVVTILISQLGPAILNRLTEATNAVNGVAPAAP
jgi:Flp pilus assembly pilin Flp